MKRSSPLKRGKPLPAKRKKPRRVAADRVRRTKPKRPPGYENPAYLAFVRTLQCCAWAYDLPGGVTQHCTLRTHAHHAGRGGGKGLKAPDTTAIPLCERHHTGDRGWHQSNGFASGWSKAQRREWADLKIAETQSLWRRKHPCPATS